LSCLVNLISDLPPEARAIPLADVAARTKLPIGAVSNWGWCFVGWGG
jgi:hypothetical protein